LLHRGKQLLTIKQDLREYVAGRPLANLEDIQTHIQDTFNIKCSRSSISRRMKDMGYVRSIIQRGIKSVEKDNLSRVSEADMLRLMADPSAGENNIGLSGKPKIKYAWLLTSQSVSRRPKTLFKNPQGAKEHRIATATNGQPSHGEPVLSAETQLDGQSDGETSTAPPSPSAHAAFPNALEAPSSYQSIPSSDRLDTGPTDTAGPHSVEVNSVLNTSTSSGGNS
jgi:hypothetical protein